MKKTFLTGLAIIAMCVPAFAQFGNWGAPQVITDGMKDAYKDYFMVGVAVNQRNISDPDQIALVKREYNSITAENDMKPQPTEPEYGVFNWENADKIYNFAKENGIKMRGHCLMWHSQIGRWMYTDEKGNLVSKEKLFENMEHHIKAICERYPDVYAWDVVNEAVADSPVRWGQSPMRQSPMYQIAGDEFLVKAFEYAAKYAPNALLFYNDYNDAEPEKSQRIYDLVKRLKDAGAKVDGIGMQAHYNIYSPSAADIDAAITKYESIVDHIHITELDIRVNEDMGGGLRFNQGKATVADWETTLQQDQYANLFKILRKHASGTGAGKVDLVNFWNVSDADSWLGTNNSPLLFDAKLQPKKPYNTVKKFDAALDNAVVLEDFVPSECNQPGQQYPMVNSQGYARFRVDAPKATSVIVTLGLGGQGGTVLHKDADGFWTGTTAGPMDEGFHYYHLIIDGGVVNDPGTNNYYGSTRWESGIEIPAHDKAFYAERNIPHGKVEQVLFWSESTNQLRKAFVYTPPTYDKSKKQKFPVLYLQHGWGENEYAWWNQGKANLILDNMIADGEIEPFICVMTYGMTNEGFRPGQMPAARPAAPAAPKAGEAPAAPAARPARPAGGMGMMMNNGFEQVLCDELIPYIDANFRTYADKAHRAMAGLSMGGMETHTITLARPELFGYYGLLSGGVYTPDEIKDIDGIKGIFVGCGSKEGPDQIRKAAEALQAAGYNAKGYVSEGTAHEFLTWRRCLKEMAPMLFK